MKETSMSDMETEPLVLVIDDEERLRGLLRIALSSAGYRVIDASTARDGLAKAATHAPDAVLLDLGLPDGDGLDVVRALREWSRVPILVISARGNEESKVRALDEGADDYVTKPFGTPELLARLRVAIRNAARLDHGPPSTLVTIGGEITIDLVRRVVTRKGEEVHLTPLEYKLLITLVRHADMVVTHRQLLELVWGPGCSERVEYLRVYMTQLRHKLEPIPARPRFLRTELGVGYRLKVD